MDKNLNFPSFCQFEITTKCNLRCKDCRVPFMDHAAIPLEVVLKGIDDIVYAGIREIELFGGEPLLYEHLPEVLWHLNKTDKIKRFAVLTNGIESDKLQKIMPEISRENSSGRGWMVVSINYTEEQCDELNGRGEDVRKSMKGWKILKKFAESCNIRVNCTINSINISTFPEIAFRVINLGGFFSFCPVIYRRRGYDSGIKFTFRSQSADRAPTIEHVKTMRKSVIAIKKLKSKYPDRVIPDLDYISRLPDVCKNPNEPYPMNCLGMGLPYLRISPIIGKSICDGKEALGIRACSDVFGREISKIVTSDLRNPEIKKKLSEIYQADQDVIKCCMEEGCFWSVTHALAKKL